MLGQHNKNFNWLSTVYGLYCIVVLAQVGGGAAYKEYRAVI